jgi:hypothetical protein
VSVTNLCAQAQPRLVPGAFHVACDLLDPASVRAVQDECQLGVDVVVRVVRREER